MKLNETVLQKLAEGSTSREGRQTLAVPDQGAGWTVVLTVDRHDDLSCAVWEMKLQRTVPAPAGASLDRSAETFRRLPFHDAITWGEIASWNRSFDCSASAKTSAPPSRSSPPIWILRLA